MAEPTRAPRPCSQPRGCTPELALCLPEDFFRCLSSLTGPGIVDNAHNHILSDRESQSSMITEQEQTGVIVEPLVKAEHLLVSGREATWGLALLLERPG